jgi:ATP-dependent helicase/nuclease subunit B
MRLVFDPALDGTGWPGPLGDRDAVSGTAWVGPMGLLGVLETQLGLGGRVAGHLERACRLARSLERANEGFWRASYERDRLGTCRRLLKDRDTLALWGWQGQSVSARLDELHRVTQNAAPGLPDRLAHVVRALGTRTIDVAALTTYAPIATLAPLWQQVIAAMAKTGVVIEEQVIPPVAARGDLARARTQGFSPTGDGSLSLLRRHGVLDTADEVAATLAAFDDLGGVVIIGADVTLDRALGQHGLPRLGLDVAPTASAQLVPLIIEAAFDPMEPGDLHALLMLDPGPIPRALAAYLVRALQRHPGRKSQLWNDELTKGLENYPEERRAQLRDRVATLLMPAVAHGAPLPCVILRARLDLIRTWAKARCETVPSLAAVFQQAEALDNALELLGDVPLLRTDLRRLCSDLAPVDWTRADAEAGLAHVADPGAVLAPARTIIWWNFTRDHAPSPGRLFLTRAEEGALLAAGVTPPDFARLMEGEAQRWRRPLELATDALVLVCPRAGESGAPNQIHPLWDELTARLERFEDVSKLEVDSLARVRPARTTATVLRPLVKPAMSVTLAAPVKLREIESPSSLERLLGCSFSWALHYNGNLREGLSEGPAAMTPLLMGLLAHELLAQVFVQNLRTPEAAATTAADLFEAQIPQLCEALALPRYQVQRATLRRAIVDSARELTRILVDAGAQVVGTEKLHGTTVLGQRVEGTLDLILSSPDFVIDLKWGRSSNREKLYSGTAIQLAAYATMRKESCRAPGAGTDVGIAYFILRTQELLTEPQARLGGGYAPGKHDGPAMWKATLDELQARQREIGQGLLFAPGAHGEETKSFLDGTKLRLGPACGYCSFDGLCGREGIL